MRDSLIIVIFVYSVLTLIGIVISKPIAITLVGRNEPNRETGLIYTPSNLKKKIFWVRWHIATELAMLIGFAGISETVLSTLRDEAILRDTESFFYTAGWLSCALWGVTIIICMRIKATVKTA